MQDDYAYIFAKTPVGIQAFRSMSPDKQIAWLDNGLEKHIEIKIKRNENDKSTIYEIRIPKKYINPVTLKEGKIIGLGLMVNDNDGDKRKTALTLTGGNEAWKKPYYLPEMIFVK